MALALVLAACGGATETPPLSKITPAPPSTASGASPSVEVPGSPIAGLIGSIDSTGLDQVHGFTLRASNGQTFTFVIGVLENGAEFPPGHLAEHLAAADPILVFFRVEDGKLVVYRLEDAG
jgi:hypothetical protein